MRRARISQEFHFDSAHHLYDYNGACANLHGHRWKIRVTLIGLVNEKSGMIIDFKEFKTIVNEYVIQHLDHVNLNDVFSFNPTAENLVVWIYDALFNAFHSEAECIELDKIELWETPECCVSYN